MTHIKDLTRGIYEEQQSHKNETICNKVTNNGSESITSNLEINSKHSTIKVKVK